MTYAILILGSFLPAAGDATATITQPLVLPELPPAEAPVGSAMTLTWSEPYIGNATWQWATNYAANSNEGGFTDWRLPTVAELQDAIQTEALSPVNCNSGSRWTSETRGNRAWAVYITIDANCNIVPSQSGQANLILKSSQIKFYMVRP